MWLGDGVDAGIGRRLGRLFDLLDRRVRLAASGLGTRPFDALGFSLQFGTRAGDEVMDRTELVQDREGRLTPSCRKFAAGVRDGAADRRPPPGTSGYPALPRRVCLNRAARSLMP